MDKLIAVRRDNRFSQIPHWVTESEISDGAYRLYGVLFKYSDNTTREAYPSRTTLAKSVRKSDRSVDGYIKELEAIKALKVLRRKRKGTNQNYTNIYHVITANPYADEELEQDAPGVDWEVVPEVAKPVSPPRATHFAESIPSLSIPTSFTSFDESNDPQKEKDLARSAKAAAPTNPGELSTAQRKTLRDALVAVGKMLESGSKFWDEDVQARWWHFIELIEQTFPDTYDAQFCDLLENGKWSVSAKVASPYVAGAELNKLIHTALGL